MRHIGSQAVDLTVVIPAFNEAERLPRSLPLLLSALAALDARVEIVLVDDGSRDQTANVAAEYLSRWRDVKLMRLPWNCGKGAAVRAGVSVASGAAIVFIDADLAADIEELPRLLALLDTADIAIGSRTKAGAHVEGRTTARRLGGTVYQSLVRRLTSATVTDTQCGFKAFQTPVAKLLFSMTTATGFGFDVEILTLAGVLGFRIAECPIRWTAVDGGHVSLRQHGVGMLQDLQRARRQQQNTPLVGWNVPPQERRPADTTVRVGPTHIRLDAPVTGSAPNLVALG